MTQIVFDDGVRPARVARKVARAPGMTACDLGLYGFTVFAWSTSWFAMHLQIGVVAPEVSLLWRFLMSTAVMFGLAAASGARLRFRLATHLRFLALGALLFSLNFLCFYYASFSTPSGLLSVLFSCTALINLVLGALFFNELIERRVVLGAALGLGGVALMFLPRLLGTSFDHTALAGLVLGALGTLSFCCGNMISLGARRAGIDTLSSTAWGMFYGTLIVATLALVRGLPFTFDWTPTYIGAMFWLALVSSVGGYVFYLTLMSRIGAARASYATVIFPVFALMISTAVEGYVWTSLAVCGLVLTFAGNLIVLGRRRPRRATAVA